jgi:hypothetical protein
MKHPPSFLLGFPVIPNWQQRERAHKATVQDGASRLQLYVGECLGDPAIFIFQSILDEKLGGEKNGGIIVSVERLPNLIKALNRLADK